MKKLENVLLCGFFALFCFGLPLAGGISRVFDGQSKEEENRALAGFPEVESLEDFLDFPSGFEVWYSDHLFLKSGFVKAKSELEIGLFRELDSEKVVLGREKGWLFHKSNDGQPMETYKKINYFTQDELAEIGENLQTLGKELGELGIKLIVMIAPDKEQIYGREYMPSSIKVMEGQGRTRQLSEYMEKEAPEVKILYPDKELEEAKAQPGHTGSLYYESDTHWNQAGAYVAARALLDEIKRQTGTEGGLFNASFIQEGTSRGDLQKLVKLGEDYNSKEYRAEGLPRAEAAKTVTDKNQEVIYEKNSCEEEGVIPVSVYLAGDSFRWNLSPYVKAQTAESVLVSRYYFDPEDLAEQEPDVFVYLIAERYLHELPVIPGYNTAALQMP